MSEPSRDDQPPPSGPRKRGPVPTGTLRRLASGWEVRVRIGSEKVGFRLTGLPKRATELQASERARLLAESAVRLADSPALRRLLEQAAAARPGRYLAAVEGAIGIAASGKAVDIPTGPVTVRTFAGEWTDGSLAKRFPDHVREKRTADGDAQRFKLYVLPLIGNHAIADVTLDDCDAVMASLPPELRPSSRRQIAQLMHRLLGLAVYPARHRTSNPIPKGWLPKVKDDLAKEALYPDEDALLMAARAVPLLRRFLYGFLAREGMRVSEALELRWTSVDVKRGFVALDKNKTNDPRDWALDPGTVRALIAWRKLAPHTPEPGDLVFSEQSVGLDRFGLAEQLREDLKLAGVNRPALFERNEHRIPIRVHDLRATFITLAFANDKTEAWISDRTGHTTSQMLNRYKRKARGFAERDMKALLPLDQAVPEFRTKGGGKPGKSDPKPDQGHGERRRTGANGEGSSAATVIAATSSPPLNPLADSSSLSWPTKSGPVSGPDAEEACGGEISKSPPFQLMPPSS